MIVFPHRELYFPLFCYRELVEMYMVLFNFRSSIVFLSLLLFFYFIRLSFVFPENSWTSNASFNFFSIKVFVVLQHFYFDMHINLFEESFYFYFTFLSIFISTFIFTFKFSKSYICLLIFCFSQLFSNFFQIYLKS